MFADFVPRQAIEEYEIKGEQRALDDCYDAKRPPKKMSLADIAGLFDFVYGP